MLEFEARDVSTLPLTVTVDEGWRPWGLFHLKPQCKEEEARAGEGKEGQKARLLAVV